MPFDSLDDVPDLALLRLYANGDKKAAAALTLRFAPKILGFATRMLRDRAEAEDVTQEAMLRLWNIAPDWREGEAKIDTWLYRITSNLCIDRIRKRRSSSLDEADEPISSDPSMHAQLMARDRKAALDLALSKLPDRQRQAVILRHIEELPNPEIAQIMGTGVEAIESLTARGKRKLAQILSGRKNELGFTDD